MISLVAAIAIVVCAIVFLAGCLFVLISWMGTACRAHESRPDPSGMEAAMLRVGFNPYEPQPTLHGAAVVAHYWHLRGIWPDFNAWSDHGNRPKPLSKDLTVGSFDA